MVHIGSRGRCSDVWQHICFEVDTVAEKIRVARNGEILGSEIKVPGLGVNKPANVERNLVLGIFVDESLTSQFCGQVTNMNIYASRRKDLVDLTWQPCNSEADLLSWNSATWTESGTAATWEEADDETVSSNKSCYCESCGLGRIDMGGEIKKVTFTYSYTLFSCILSF